MWKAAGSVALVLVVGVACFDPYCGDESRSITAVTRFAEPWDPQAGYVQLTLVEHRVDEPRESLWWIYLSDSLQGHILEARLTDAGDGFRSLLELPVDSLPPQQAGSALFGSLGPYEGPTVFQTLFELVIDDRVAMELTTDFRGRESMRQTLVSDPYRGWNRPICY